MLKCNSSHPQFLAIRRSITGDSRLLGVMAALTQLSEKTDWPTYIVPNYENISISAVRITLIG